MLSSFRRRLLALPAFGLLLLGCAEIEQAPPPLHPRGKASAKAPVEAAGDGDVKTAAAGDGVRQGSLAPRVHVEGVADGHEALADAIVAASKSPMAECQPNSGGGVVRIRVKSTDKSASFDVEPDSSIDEHMRHCVLEALSTIDVPDTLSQSSPSSRASSGFSSIITVKW
jgi:hypothetical protein